MLTLKELRGMVTVTKNEGRVPTVKQLQELEDTLVVKKKIDSETEISVYKTDLYITVPEKTILYLEYGIAMNRTAINLRKIFPQ